MTVFWIVYFICNIVWTCIYIVSTKALLNNYNLVDLLTDLLFGVMKILIGIFETIHQKYIK